jgi:ubiquinone/menaquinone biosynthesis C-methylase UbiE
MPEVWLFPNPRPENRVTLQLCGSGKRSDVAVVRQQCGHEGVAYPWFELVQGVAAGFDEGLVGAGAGDDECGLDTTLRSVTEPVFEFSEVFDADYLYFYGPYLEAVSDAQAATIWRLLDLEPGMQVLDLACGHGRIANRLAQLGAHVTGLDATALFLEHARRDAAERGVEVDYISGDMRSLPWPEDRFERVISWFTSFGYFGDADNQKVLSEAHRVLHPGGRLLVETNNLAELLPRWLPAVVVERDGNFMIDRSTFEPLTGRAVTDRTCIRDGQVRRFPYSLRMFIGVELRSWLLTAGFDRVEQVDHEGAALTARSDRMVSVAHKASGRKAR